MIWKYWKWPIWWAAALMVPFLLIDLAFLGANLLKVFSGGWVPLLIGAMVMVVMLTWRRGARILATKTRRLETPIDSLIQSLDRKQPYKVPGTAVFLTADPSSAPTALLHSLKHYKVLHEQNVVLTIIIESTPRVAAADRVTLEPLGKIFTRILIRFGFMETPNIPKALALARKRGLSFDIMSTSFFLSRRAVRPDPKSGMPVWQDRLFIILAKNADDTFTFPPTGWSRSVRKSRCEEAGLCGFDRGGGIGEPLPVGHIAPEPGHLPFGIAPSLGLGLGLGLLEACGASKISPQLTHAMSAHGWKAIIKRERDKSAYLIERAGLDHTIKSRVDRGIKRLALGRDDELQRGIGIEQRRRVRPLPLGERDAGRVNHFKRTHDPLRVARPDFGGDSRIARRKLKMKRAGSERLRLRAPMGTGLRRNVGNRRQALKQSLEIEACAPDQDRHPASALRLCDRVRRILKPASNRIRLARRDRAVKQVRNPPHLLLRRLRREHLELAIDLHRIGIDDGTAQIRSERKGRSRLAARRRPGNEN